ncbi:Glycosyl transferase, family 2 [Bosea sp. LC85]|uniref:glycosyltransferase family 2 protein n=1 Tax=Bosea sp. LC85 TaxID=1502851 RepID=UPI0004E3454D|nr:glycosyltransferase [Bosea sp. LC85]KFC64610.1 Glycosyl transferase, family 2 [Bosea sp. LC85]
MDCKLWTEVLLAIPDLKDPAKHRDALVGGALWLHAQGYPRQALALLDRFDRTGRATSRSGLIAAMLNAEIDSLPASVSMLRKAFVLDPLDPQTQKAFLLALIQTGATGQSAEMANFILDVSKDAECIAAALDVLQPGWGVHGRMELSGDLMQGWLIWRGGERVRSIVVQSEDVDHVFEVNASLSRGSTDPHFAAIEIPWAEEPWREVRDVSTGISLDAPNWSDTMEAEALFTGDANVAVTVIIAVHKDFQATQACLKSLMDDATEVKRRIIVIDDASPDPAIEALLADAAAQGFVALLKNETNRGFVGSVNRALRLVGGEDVVILNSDTVVPPRWLDRLNAVAQSASIGSITPLSNNGELVSVPGAFRANPFCGPASVAAMDACASSLAGSLVDIPNGVGFCLYLCHRALKVAGLLSPQFGRGYLEDVEYCLRIARAGLRNVCATSVFVGHKGGASFGAHRGYLVAANSARLVAQCPEIEERTRAFMTLDPFAPLREALHWAFLEVCGPLRLVFAEEAIGTSLLADIADDDPSLSVLAVTVPRDGSLMVTCHPTGVRASWPADRGMDAFLDYARRLPVRDCIVIGPGNLEARLSSIFSLGVPADIIVAERGAIEDRARMSPPGRTWPFRRVIEAGWFGVPLHRPEVTDEGSPPVSKPGRPVIGIVSAASPAETAEWSAAFAAAVRAEWPEANLILFGETDRDVELMTEGRLFVTGPVDRGGLRALGRRHGCGCIVVLTSQYSLLNGGLAPLSGWNLSLRHVNLSARRPLRGGGEPELGELAAWAVARTRPDGATGELSSPRLPAQTCLSGQVHPRGPEKHASRD